MWPFKTKAHAVGGFVEPAKSKWELDQSRVEALRSWRDVGQEFEYLGRRMVVVGHSRIEFAHMSMWLVPEVRARYADDKGQVHELALSESEALALARSSELRPNDRANRATPAED